MGAKARTAAAPATHPAPHRERRVSTAPRRSERGELERYRSAPPLDMTDRGELARYRPA